MGFSNFKKITKKIDIPLDDEIKNILRILILVFFTLYPYH
ncbi:hypothetical protein ECDEC3F_0446 [Escherichia coli DEC3F]|nr:hypothetical protein ECDEC3B_0107 [Escherichia coli DEC3B]EHU85032.1 hypothetical protein ECDEC3E_0432 [Escherichia coli DEC3E]EHU96458.1 hypothetical protein ECDEC3F_0446 [Escherichia coli DEC3F]EHU98094.1 hypothetical protein ECDEC4A_0121 [Escherichia coli DEC4A]EHV04139.1 hypothetical protein ECDEC4B_0116 [Escherichia coli DEC4B]EHV15396.1 hypothetical protein ECDEC4D_0132 [Escherichia coli DEC4D]EHV18790.1 hypothetical protein ECDEC4E_0161 [Escherichia coli DEC4E]EHV30588.1 hypothetic